MMYDLSRAVSMLTNISMWSGLLVSGSQFFQSSLVRFFCDGCAFRTYCVDIVRFSVSLDALVGQVNVSATNAVASTKITVPLEENACAVYRVRFFWFSYILFTEGFNFFSIKGIY
jgi:hypothetical protein